MPVHTYHCEECDHEFDAHQAFSDDALTVCPKCGKEALYKIYKPALVVFKGSGFYVTDSKSASSTLTSGANSKAGHNGSDSKEAPGTESKKTEPAKTESKVKESTKTEK
jgi:putative FmdB family regulatory protein